MWILRDSFSWLLRGLGFREVCEKGSVQVFDSISDGEVDNKCRAKHPQFFKEMKGR